MLMFTGDGVNPLALAVCFLKLRLLTLTLGGAFDDKALNVIATSPIAARLQYLCLNKAALTSVGLDQLMTSFPALRVLKLRFGRTRSAPSLLPSFLAAPISFRQQLLYLEACFDPKREWNREAKPPPHSDYVPIAQQLMAKYPNLWAAQVHDTTPSAELKYMEFEYPIECLKEDEDCTLDEADPRVVDGIAGPQDSDILNEKEAALAAKARAVVETEEDRQLQARSFQSRSQHVMPLSHTERMAQFHDPFHFLLALKQRAGLKLQPSEESAAKLQFGLADPTTAMAYKLYPMAPQAVDYEYISGCP